MRPAFILTCMALLGAAACAHPPFEERLQRARGLIEDGYYREAARESGALLEEAEAFFGPESLQAADAIEVLVTALWRDDKVDTPEAEGMARRALAIRDKLIGPDTPPAAAMHVTLGRVFVARDDMNAAMAEFERSLAIREKNLGPTHPDVVESLLGMVFYQPNREAAKRMAERALTIAEKATGPDSRLTADSLCALGSVLGNLAAFREGHAALDRALGIYEGLLRPDHPLIANCLRSLGYLFFSNGDFASARPLLERALSILERTRPEGDAITQVLNCMAMTLAETGDLERAITMFARSLSIKERIYGPGDFDVAMSRNLLGVALLMSGDFAGARKALEKALAGLQDVEGSDRLSTLFVENNLGFLLVNMGDYAAARPLLEEAYAGAAEIDGKKTQDFADIATSLGDLELMSGSLPRARALYGEAQEARLRLFGAHHPKTAIGSLSLARVDLLTGRPWAALAKAARAEAIARTDFQATARSLTEREALRYEAIRASGLDLMFAALTELSSRALTAADIRRSWDTLIRSRAMVLDEMASRHRVVTGSPDLQAPMQRLNEARDRLARLTARGPDPSAPGDFVMQIKAAMASEEKAERALAEVSAAFRHFHDKKTTMLSDVRRSLPEGTALVGFVVYNHLIRPAPERAGLTLQGAPGNREMHARGSTRYAALVLGPGSAEPAFVPLGPADRIEDAVRAWREAAAERQGLLADTMDAVETRYRSAAEPLRRLVWDPIAALVRDARQVFIVPDGSLNLVSFATLPSAGGGYLAESAPAIHYLSAERDAVLPVGESGAGRGLLAVGGPDFDAIPGAVVGWPDTALATLNDGAPDGERFYRGALASCVDLRSLRFAPLPGSRSEVEDLAKIWEQAVGSQRDPADARVQSLVGAASTETAVKRGARGHRVIHLATHGFIGGDCETSLTGLRGARASLAEMDLLAVMGDNPLLLSGLALAGANRRAEARPDQDDGILTGEEIASLDFSGTEWVVLSACETALGKVQTGEGILGLRRAFETAGAATLIMSLWPVDDEATRHWMRALYEGRLSGLTTVEAVRRADRTILETRRRSGLSTHPFLWGGFVAAGDWR